MLVPYICSHFYQPVFGIGICQVWTHGDGFSLLFWSQELKPHSTTTDLKCSRLHHDVQLVILFYARDNSRLTQGNHASSDNLMSRSSQFEATGAVGDTWIGPVELDNASTISWSRSAMRTSRSPLMFCYYIGELTAYEAKRKWYVRSPRVSLVPRSGISMNALPHES